MALHSAWPAGTPRIHWTFAPKTPEISRSEHEGDEVGIGRFDLVPDHVRPGRLNDLSGMIRLLGGPVPEAGPEPVRHWLQSGAFRAAGTAASRRAIFHAR